MPALTTKLDGRTLIITFNDSRLDEQARTRVIGDALIKLAAGSSAENILLDFRRVSFLASPMVGQLFLLNSKCKAKKINLKMCHVAEVIQSVFETVRLNDFIEVLEDEAAARKAFSRPAPESDEPLDRPSADEIRRSAEQGDAGGQYQLARCYENGRGLEQDWAAALKWYQSAAEHGHPEAQYRVGMAFAYGIAVDQDYDEALKWYRAAAEQGHRDAQYALGMSYRHGIAVPEDHEAAAQWYQKAAAQGHEKAQQELDRLDRQA